jgi:hypothetical protein
MKINIEEVIISRCIELRNCLERCHPFFYWVTKSTFKLNHEMYFGLSKRKIYESSKWKEIYGPKEKDAHIQRNPDVYELLPRNAWESLKNF